MYLKKIKSNVKEKCWDLLYNLEEKNMKVVW